MTVGAFPVRLVHRFALEDDARSRAIFSGDTIDISIEPSAIGFIVREHWAGLIPDDRYRRPTRRRAENKQASRIGYHILHGYRVTKVPSSADD